jgi:putative oxidoreductase
MPKLVVASRVALGLLLIAFGVDYFVPFIPLSPRTTPAGEAFLQALIDTGYLFTLVKGVEICTGALLLAGVRPQLGVALLAPVAVNIGLYHLFLDPNGIVPGAAVVVLEGVLLAAYRDAFAPLFSARAELTVARPASSQAALPAAR